MEKVYIRDKRSPVPKTPAVSKVMSANKAKHTSPEILLRKYLWSSGYKGYRLNWKKIPGRPDIVFVNRKVAIFVNGCFWHNCPICDKPLPKHNTDFWKNKFDKNTRRDSAKVAELVKLGYKVITIWECELKKNFNMAASKIIRELLPGS